MASPDDDQFETFISNIESEISIRRLLNTDTEHDPFNTLVLSRLISLSEALKKHRKIHQKQVNLQFTFDLQTISSIQSSEVLSLGKSLDDSITQKKFEDEAFILTKLAQIDSGYDILDHLSITDNNQKKRIQYCLDECVSTLDHSMVQSFKPIDSKNNTNLISNLKKVCQNESLVCGKKEEKFTKLIVIDWITDSTVFFSMIKSLLINLFSNPFLSFENTVFINPHLLFMKKNDNQKVLDEFLESFLLYLKHPILHSSMNQFLHTELLSVTEEEEEEVEEILEQDVREDHHSRYKSMLIHRVIVYVNFWFLECLSLFKIKLFSPLTSYFNVFSNHDVCLILYLNNNNNNEEEEEEEEEENQFMDEKTKKKNVYSQLKNYLNLWLNHCQLSLLTHHYKIEKETHNTVVQKKNENDTTNISIELGRTIRDGLIHDWFVKTKFPLLYIDAMFRLYGIITVKNSRHGSTKKRSRVYNDDDDDDSLIDYQDFIIRLWCPIIAQNSNQFHNIKKLMIKINEICTNYSTNNDTCFSSENSELLTSLVEFASGRCSCLIPLLMLVVIRGMPIQSAWSHFWQLFLQYEHKIEEKEEEKEKGRKTEVKEEEKGRKKLSSSSYGWFLCDILEIIEFVIVWLKLPICRSFQSSYHIVMNQLLDLISEEIDTRFLNHQDSVGLSKEHSTFSKRVNSLQQLLTS